MQGEVFDGVVIRVKDYGENDRYLTVLTQDGRISVLSKGAKSFKGRQMPISQLYTYASFECYRHGDLPILKGGSSIRSFYALSADFDRMNLAAYLCDLAYELTDEGTDAGEIYRLLLNSLYAISENLYPNEHIKAAFELRAMFSSGYAPDLGLCRVCKKQIDTAIYLDVMNGSLLCSSCLQKSGEGEKVPRESLFDDLREAEVLCPVSASGVAAMKYLLSAPPERIFSFQIKEENEKTEFYKAAETYLLSHLGRSFDSLDFYRRMQTPPDFDKEKKE